MPDPNARKRLKKRMLERWENEGGRVANDTTSETENSPTSGNQGRSQKLSSPRETPTASAPASPKRRTPNRK
jgi:hypothetical protein